MRTLSGKVALVTGASRGAGRAIAAVLGEAGATVYVTGRTVRGGAAVDGLPGTIEDVVRRLRWPLVQASRKIEKLTDYGLPIAKNSSRIRF